MELAVAPEFTICPTGQFTIEQLIKVDRVERERERETGEREREREIRGAVHGVLYQYTGIL